MSAHARQINGAWHRIADRQAAGRASPQTANRWRDVRRVLAIVALSAVSAIVPATPILDFTFGLYGSARIGDAGAAAITPSAVIGLPDGRVVIVASSTAGTGSRTTVLRLTGTGAPDPTFGNTGQTTLPEVLYCNPARRAVPMADGGVVVLTSSSPDAACTTASIHGAVVQGDGAPDDGYRVANLPASNGPRPLTLAQSLTGDVYVAGTGVDTQQAFTYAARLTAGGALDPAFGLVTLEGGPIPVERAAVVAPLADGSLTAATLAGTRLTLARLDAHGQAGPVPERLTIDLAPFAPNEARLRLIDFFHLADGAYLAIVQRDSAAGNALIIMRAAGNLSGSYGVSMLINSGTPVDWPVAAALHDGTVVIAEVSGAGAYRQSRLRRMFANSAFDPTWGVGQAYTLRTGMVVTALAEDAAGRLLVTGADADGAFVSRILPNLEPYYATGFALEFHNTVLDHYFMTADRDESDLISQGAAGPGWSRTGSGFRVHTDALGVPRGATQVCRFYGNRALNPATGIAYGPNSHAYILEGPECDAVRRDPGWNFEGYAFWIFPPVDGQCTVGRDPVYRAYNHRAAQNDSNHRYTKNTGVYQQMRALGWTGEGIVMCAPQ